MNIALRKISLLILVSLTLAVSAFAGGKVVKPRPPFLPPYDSITAVDTTAQTITIGHINSKDTKTPTYKVDKTTEIQVNGVPGTLADIKTGMKVSVTPGMDETRADRIVVSPAPTPPPAPPAAH